VRFDRDVPAPIEPVEASHVVRIGIALLEAVDVLILSDYAKGTVTSDVACALVAEARRRDVMVVVDTKATQPSCYRGCTAVTPQVRELASWVGRNLAPRDYAPVARRLAEQLECCLILVTEGEDGMTLVSDETSWHLPASTRRAVSSLGAGDTVAAAFALGLVTGLEPVAAASLATDAAGVVVQQPGMQPVSLTALRGLVGETAHPSRGR
jgi:D-beta-D-heptose 7-phosphate kinase/D-beta-D-heptose 1-phosphate adenosyltransferase